VSFGISLLLLIAGAQQTAPERWTGSGEYYLAAPDGTKATIAIAVSKGRVTRCEVSPKNVTALLPVKCEDIRSCVTTSAGDRASAFRCVQQGRQISEGEAAAPTVERRTVSLEARPVRFAPPVRPAMEAYRACLTATFHGAALADKTSLDAYRAARLDACSAARVQAIVVADIALRRAGWLEKAKRKASIEQTFSDVEASWSDELTQLQALRLLPTRRPE
jgi:hypothetical protein